MITGLSEVVRVVVVLKLVVQPRVVQRRAASDSEANLVLGEKS